MNCDAVLQVVDTLLQDVAEDPKRLDRAMEIARRDVPSMLDVDVQAVLAADREAALRDVFATAALGAIICKPESYYPHDPASVAQRAYRYADAMMGERKQRR